MHSSESMDSSSSSSSSANAEDPPCLSASCPLPPPQDKLCLHIATTAARCENLAPPDAQCSGRIFPVDSEPVLNKERCGDSDRSFPRAGGTYAAKWAMSNRHGSGLRLHGDGDVLEQTWKLDVAPAQGRRKCVRSVDGSCRYAESRRHGMMRMRDETSSCDACDDGEGRIYGEAYGHGACASSDGATFLGSWTDGDNKHGEETMNHRPDTGLEQHLPNALAGFSGEEERIFHEHKVRTLALPPNADKNQQRPLQEKIQGIEMPQDCLSRFTCTCRYASEDGKENHFMGKDGKQAGENISYGHRSYDLMLRLQLGIRYSIGKVTPQQSKRILTRGDFDPESAIKLRFPRKGSRTTPRHPLADFEWKDYCPIVFRKLRELAKIDAAEYMLSICGTEGLRELASPGKSGSVFYLSHDQHYMVKTLRRNEAKVLLTMLPRYYDHVKKYENTLVMRVLGLHRVKPVGGRKVRFIVMANVLATDIRIHKRFDLKGSSHGRSTGKADTNEDVTLKDLDLDYVFRLEQRWRDAICRQIAEDCKFLESEHIMDYSLLLGLHFKEPSRNPAEIQDLPLHEVVISSFIESNGDFVEMNIGLKGFGSRIGMPEEDGGHRASSFKSDSRRNKVGNGWVAHHPKAGCRKARLGFNVPATACRRIAAADGGDEYGAGGDALLFFGIIDILQVYDMRKRLEHACKSIWFDPLSISAVDPGSYSARFQHLMRRIFQADPGTTAAAAFAPSVF